MSILLLAEHDGQRLTPATYQAVSAAQSWAAPLDVLVVGHAADAVAAEAAAISGVTRIILTQAPHLEHALAEDVANIISGIASDYQVILAAHSSFSRNILPRVAAVRDVAILSDVLQIKGDNTYVRATYAGNIHNTLQSRDALQVLTVRASNFAAAGHGGQAELVILTAPAAWTETRWLGEARSQSERPPLNSAKVVVSGGRSLGSAEKFEQLLSPLARKLGAALGATRAAVDAGYAPNDIQVGQTGVVVAPDLYIAIGVSGAIQHTYGMRDSRVVVAINQDPDAPIFQIADYGLVANLFEAVPELSAAI